MGCLCGCGSNDLHCLLPNRPPSPNTFYESFWAPNFTYMLENRLDTAARKLEPSKRIWWREEFGGCAPDREPLDSEIWNKKWEDRGNVLRTSPPAFEDQPQVSQQDQCPKSLLNTRNSSPDEAASPPRQAFRYEQVHASQNVSLYKNGEYSTDRPASYWADLDSSRRCSPQIPTSPRHKKSPSHYVPDRFPPLNIPEFSEIKSSRSMGKESQRGVLRDKVGAVRNRQLGMNLGHSNGVGASPMSTLDGFPADRAGEESARPFTDDWNHADNLEKSRFQAPTVRRKARSPKSPTHYIPDKFPLHFPDPATMKASRRKPKVYTAEEDKQLLQSALRKHKEFQLERRRLYGIPLDLGWLLPAKSSLSIAQRDQYEQAPNNIPIQDKASKPEEHKQVKHSPTDDYPKRLRSEWNCSPPLVADVRTYPNDQRESLFREHSVRPKVRSPKSPTHYVPDKFPPLHFPDPATVNVSRRKPRVYTAEEDEQFLQSALRKQKDQLERLRLYDIPLKRGKVLPAKSSPSISQTDQCEQAPKARSPKSPTHYVHDKFPPLHFPDPATMNVSRRKPRVYTAEEDEQLLQSALRKSKIYQLERLRLYGIPLDHGLLPAESSPSITQRDQCEQAPNNIPIQDKASRPKEHKQVKHSPTDDYPKRLRPEWNGSPPLVADVRTHPDDQRESLFREPSVRPKARSPKSPTHYVPDRHPPLKIPDFSKEHPDRRALRKRKKPTAEEDEQHLQADSQWLKVMELVKVMRLERLRRHDKASEPEEHQQLKKSLYQKIEAMNLRRSHRHGITIRQPENASSASSHSVSHGDPVEEELSIAEMFPASEKLRQLKPSLLEKIEAIRLRRSRRHGTALYRSKASVPMGSDSTSQHVEAGEVSSKIELRRRSSEASPQQLEPSLWNKEEAIKQRLSRQQGTAIYRAEEAGGQDSASPSPVDQAPGVLLDTQVQKQNLTLERPPKTRDHMSQEIKAIKLRRSDRHGAALSV